MWNRLIGALSLMWVEESLAMSLTGDFKDEILEGRVKNRIAYFDEWQKANEDQLPVHHEKRPVALRVNQALSSKIKFFDQWVEKNKSQPLSLPRGSDKKVQVQPVHLLGEISESVQEDAPSEQLSTSSSQILIKEKERDAFIILESYVEEHKSSLLTNGLLKNYMSGLIDILEGDDEPLKKRKNTHEELDQWWSLLANTQVWGRGPFGINIGRLMGQMLSESMDCDSQESVILKAYQKGLVDLSAHKIKKLEQLRAFKKIAFDFYENFNYVESFNKAEKDEAPKPWWK